MKRAQVGQIERWLGGSGVATGAEQLLDLTQQARAVQRAREMRRRAGGHTGPPEPGAALRTERQDRHPAQRRQPPQRADQLRAGYVGQRGAEYDQLGPISRRLGEGFTPGRDAVDPMRPAERQRHEVAGRGVLFGKQDA